MLAYAQANQQPWKSNHHQTTLLLIPQMKTLKDMHQLHAHVTTTGLINNPRLTSKLITTLSSSPHLPLLHFARFLLLSHIETSACNTYLYNSILKACTSGNDGKSFSFYRHIEAISLFSLMLSRGVSPDPFSFSLALKACSRLSLLKQGLQIHSLLLKTAFFAPSSSSFFLYNSLIGLYSKCGLVDFARWVFDRMPVRDSVSWNSMIDGYVKNGNMESARDVFDRMSDGDKNLVTWNSMIAGYTREVGCLEVARELFDEMPRRDVVSWNSMIDGYVKSGRLEDAFGLFELMPERDVISWVNMIHGFGKIGCVEMARYLFDKMPERDVVAWNAMMAGYLQNGHCGQAIKIFHRLLNEGVLDPDQTTLVIALSAVAELGCIDRGKLIHKFVETNGLCLDGYLGVALVDMYSKCGSIESAFEVFENVERKTIDHWNAMIGGLAIHGLGELALTLFAEMQRRQLRPDDITFIGVLNACSHAGLIKEGLICFELMRWVYNVEPKVQHYGCLVDILGRAGHLEAAWKLIMDMPIEPNDVVWRALLRACGNCGNFGIGEQAAKHLIELDACSSSSYVLLSNLYAGVGMWFDASKVRMTMKEKGLRKVPGCSWIELDGIVHEFVVGDK